MWCFLFTKTVNKILTLIKKDISIELKNSNVISGILLYVVSGILITYVVFDANISVKNWCVLYWLIFMFSSITAVSKSFVQEDKSRNIYYYLTAKPQHIILAKIIYNVVLLLLVVAIHTLLYMLMLGNPINNILLFVASVILGTSCISSILTLISAIASKASNNFTLLSILSFPLVLPVLVVLQKLTEWSLLGTQSNVPLNYLLAILLLTIAIISLAYILFPKICNE